MATTDDPAALLARVRRMVPAFARLAGVELDAVAPDRMQGSIAVRPETGNGLGTMHGGALMTFADTLGALGAVVNLEPGQRTTTLESKTNFIGTAPVGTRLHGEAVPLHRGRTTQIWQTRITREDGRLVAIVTQTQLVLTPAGLRGGGEAG